MADASIDSREYRNTMGLFATGVTVVTARMGRQRRGMTANSFTSVSLHPPLLLVCVDNGSSMHPLLEAADSFAVNILANDQREVSDVFARRGEGEAVMNGVPFHDGPLGSPILEGVLAWAECRIEERYTGGDHTIVVGRVQAIAAERPSAGPLLFFSGDYRSIGAVIEQ